ncbi:hypothetical protein [Algoriphagus litoralis]|uniref:hypothetical protein n=1 Tax=Algoriphagus litoralis TaxID=2202829 RepID=UPI000DB920BF|nr:hypothetical protein [Algoriphagus litoralis]
MTKILFGATLLCVVIILAGINRGFDISDEGLYLLLANPLQQNQAGIFNYDLFFKAIFKVTGYSFSLIELRILRLLGYGMAAWALMGFWKNISNQAKAKTEIFWLSCLGLFTGYGFLPPTTSYNSLTVVLTCFWLFLMTKEEKSFRRILGLGVLLAIWIYVKISLVFVFFPLTLLILIFWQKVKPIYVLGLLLPMIFSELFFLTFLDENAWLRLQDGIPLNTQRNGYQYFLMLKNIAVGGFWSFSMGLLFMGIGYFRKSESSLYPALKLITAYFSLLIAFLTHITDECNHLFLLAAAAFLGYQLGVGAFKPSKTNLWILLLLILPFLLHFGSNVYWLRIGIHYLVFWILAARWILKDLKWELNLASLLICLLLVFNGIWWHPFGHEKPLWSQKVPWHMEDGTQLFLDPDLVDIVSEIKEFKIQYSKAEVLAAYRIPGLSFLAGSTLPISPAIWDKSQVNAQFSGKPKMMIYNKFEDLPESWSFRYQKELGVFRSDTLLLLWD